MIAVMKMAIMVTHCKDICRQRHLLTPRHCRRFLYSGECRIYAVANKHFSAQMIVNKILHTALCTTALVMQHMINKLLEWCKHVRVRHAVFHSPTKTKTGSITFCYCMEMSQQKLIYSFILRARLFYFSTILALKKAHVFSFYQNLSRYVTIF